VLYIYVCCALRESCSITIQPHSQQLNRVPESFDLFTMGKILYSKGDFRGSVKVLELYRRSGGSELPGLHLLGHAYYKHGDKQQALGMYACTCVRECVLLCVCT
jgi:hypothetical protein